MKLGVDSTTSCKLCLSNDKRHVKKKKINMYNSEVVY